MVTWHVACLSIPTSITLKHLPLAYIVPVIPITPSTTNNLDCEHLPYFLSQTQFSVQTSLVTISLIFSLSYTK